MLILSKISQQPTQLEYLTYTNMMACNWRKMQLFSVFEIVFYDPLANNNHSLLHPNTKQIVQLDRKL